MIQCLGGFNEYPIQLIADTPVRFVSQLFILMGMVLQGPTPRAQDGVEGGDWCKGCVGGCLQRAKAQAKSGWGWSQNLDLYSSFQLQIIR